MNKYVFSLIFQCSSHMLSIFSLLEHVYDAFIVEVYFFIQKFVSYLFLIKTSESVPKRGKMIFYPFFEICSTLQGCNPITFPHIPLLPCSVQCEHFEMLGYLEKDHPTHCTVCRQMISLASFQKQLE